MERGGGKFFTTPASIADYGTGEGDGGVVISRWAGHLA